MGRRHGESVYQRGRQGGRAGQWVAVADLGWSGGRRDRREFTGKTKAEALLKRDAFLHKRAGGFTLPRGRPVTVAEWAEHWLHHVAKPGVEARTWHSSYKPAIERYVVPFFVRIPLPELTEEDIEAWHAWLARKPLAPATRRKVHRVLRTALEIAVHRDHLSRNPCSGVRAPKVRPHEITPPTGEEMALILERCRTWPNGARWVLAIATGLRQGEALALRWRDVKLTAPASVTVRQSRARVNGEWVVKAPKTASSRRTVRLPGIAVAALKAHKAAQEVASLDGLVFTRRGQPVYSKTDWRDWQALLADLGLPAYRVHDLRHLTATLLLEAGQDVRVVQEILGHSSAAVTRGVYQHVTDRLQAGAVSAMDEALGGWE